MASSGGRPLQVADSPLYGTCGFTRSLCVPGQRDGRSTTAMEPLPRSYYRRDARTVAIDLIGRRIVRTTAGPHGPSVISGTIVETEAYLGAIDLACHGSRGQTPRNATMFGPPGYAYVYLIYGIYHCLNAVVGEVGDPSAVLIRAAVIDEHDSRARPHPGTGPGRVARALMLTRHDDATDLCAVGSPLVVLAGDRRHNVPLPACEVRAGPRIGMGASAREWALAPLRFWIAGHPAVSGTRRADREGIPITS
jgi:DNA-3-methyladenine glycosylase